MALKTLKGVEKIGGFNVMHFGLGEPVTRPFHYVQVDHKMNTIHFRIQDGPIREVGVNGCQVDTLIHAASDIIKGLDKNFPCEENREALHHLHKAIATLEKRKADRVSRGVEGTNKK